MVADAFLGGTDPDIDDARRPSKRRKPKTPHRPRSPNKRRHNSQTLRSEMLGPRSNFWLARPASRRGFLARLADDGSHHQLALALMTAWPLSASCSCLCLSYRPCHPWWHSFVLKVIVRASPQVGHCYPLSQDVHGKNQSQWKPSGNSSQLANLRETRGDADPSLRLTHHCCAIRVAASPAHLRLRA